MNRAGSSLKPIKEYDIEQMDDELCMDLLDLCSCLRLPHLIRAMTVPWQALLKQTPEDLPRV